MEAEVYITTSAIETQALAALFAQRLFPGDIVGFEGDLGSGKTCFIQGLCQALGAGNARSPSFTLIQLYEGVYPLCHIDVYRLQDARELLDLGWEELSGGGNICLIEWADRLKSLGIAYRYYVKLEYAGADDTRRIVISYPGNCSAEP